MNKKIKQANRLLIFTIIYISVSLIQKINFYQLLVPNTISDYDSVIPNRSTFNNKLMQSNASYKYYE